MKLDYRLKKDLFTSNQRFFLGCWFNKINSTSLDSHRVKAINPLNALEELQKILNIKVSNNNDISMIYEESRDVIQQDPILKSKHEFTDITYSLFSKLKKEHSEKKFTKSCTLTNSLLREAINYIRNNYLLFCFEYFNQQLVDDIVLNEVEQNELSIITGHFLSYLMHSGASFETLINYYKNILSNKKKGRNLGFSSRLKLLKRIVTNDDSEFEVIFRLEFHSKELIDSFPDEIDGIKFSSKIEDLNSEYPPLKKIISSNYPTLKFARLLIKARDERHAGTLAYTKVYSVIDLIRFEYITKPIIILDDYICVTESENHKLRLLTVPRLMPNPNTAVTEQGFGVFLSMVSSLVNNQSIKKDDKDQILSAFKFYRIGGDTSIDENRLVNWWISVEHLSQSNKKGSNIGEKVIQTLLPILSINYFYKHFSYIRQELSFIKLQIDDAEIMVKDCSLTKLKEYISDDLIFEQIINQLDGFEYVIYLLTCFKNMISTNKLIAQAINSHKDRIKKQIYRVYRARCDIVHSTDAIVNISLLSANLEFYLKQTLSHILKDLVNRPTIESMEEIFLRSNLALGQVIETLHKDKDDYFIKLLD